MTQKRDAFVDLSDFILKMDRAQNRYSRDARFCPIDRDHGRLGVHGSGSVLICTAKHCQHHEAIIRETA